MSDKISINDELNTVVINNVNQNITITTDGIDNEVSVTHPTTNVVIVNESTPSITIVENNVEESNNDQITVRHSTIDTSIVSVEVPDPVVLVINTPGPQGPQGPAGPPGTIDGVDISAFVLTSSFNPFTASYYSDSASFDARINAGGGGVNLSGYVTTSSFNYFTSSYTTGSFTGSFRGSFIGTSSWASNYLETDPVFVAKSGSFVTTSSFNSFTSSYNTGSFTGSFFGTSSWSSNYNENDPVFVSKSGSFTTTSSFNSFTSSIQNEVVSLTNATSSYVLNSQTGSFSTTSSFNSFTSSYNTGSFTGSFIGELTGTAATASFVTGSIFVGSNTVVSSSYALTASYALNAGGSGVATLIDSIGARVYTDDSFITAGSKGYKHIPYNADIVKTRTMANTNGYIDVNIKRNGTTLGTISLSNQSSSLDTVLSGWTTSLNEDDLIEFYVSQSSTYITDVSIFIDIQSR